MTSQMMTPAQVRGIMGPAMTENTIERHLDPNKQVVTGLQRKIIVYYLEGEPTEQVVKIMAVSLMIIGKSTSESLRQWQTWVLTWTCVAFPEMARKFRTMGSSEFILTPVPAEYLNALMNADTQIRESPDVAINLPSLPDMPVVEVSLTTDFWNCGTIPGVYGYYSLVVHLMGKQITASTRDAITTRRPSNLIDKFKCHSVAYVLRGNGRMSDTAHTMVHDAWMQCNAPRKVTIMEFCQLRGRDDLASDMVSTMFRLLEYAGMQPAVFIHHLLSSCPWVINEIPILKPAYDTYVRSVIAFANAPAEIRPYLKLIHGDNSLIFHSKTLQQLTAVAVLWMSITQETMAGYNAPGGDKAKAAFIRIAAKKGIDISSGAHMDDVVKAPAPAETEESV